LTSVLITGFCLEEQYNAHLQAWLKIIALFFQINEASGRKKLDATDMALKSTILPKRSHPFED
jgi:hypothetical protein